MQFAPWLAQVLATLGPVQSSLLASTVVSLCPVALIVLLPRHLPARLLQLLVGFAVGSLLGDVLLHVFPAVFQESPHHDHHHDHHRHHHHRHNENEGHSHGGHAHHHGDPRKGLAVIAGILVFLLLDKTLRVVTGGGHHHHHHDHGDGEEHHHENDSLKHQEESETTPKRNLRRRKGTSSKAQRNAKPNAAKTHEENRESAVQPKSAGYLTILAGLVHCVTDGFTLAISFHASPVIGLSTTVAVLLHEVPHKLGDYAIMMKSGFTKRRAIAMSLVSAAGSVGGALAGCFLQNIVDHRNGGSGESNDGASRWIVSVTAGGMLYTALVGMLPEILETPRLPDFLVQVLSLLAGVATMTWIAME